MHDLTGQLNVKLINCHLDELLACILCSIEVESLSHHCLAWHAMYTGYFGGQKSSYDTSFYFITASVNSSLDFVIKL